MIYSEGLIRARETIAREIKEINENMDEDTIVMAIAKTQEESLVTELTDHHPVAEESAEQNEKMMKRLSVGLLSRRSSKKDGQEMNSATNCSESCPDTNTPVVQRRIRRVTFSG